MTLTEFYDAVARVADTASTKISAAETRRVLSEGFKVLATLDAASFADVMAKGLENAKSKTTAAKK
jgi:hypothetical protein